MSRRPLLCSLLLAWILIAVLSSLASAKLLPGDPIVAVARGRNDKMTTWATTVHACIGQTVYLNAVGDGPQDCTAWSHDLDYESDPHTVCDTVSFTWRYTTGGQEYVRSGYLIDVAFLELGTHNCVVTVSDDGGNDNDADKTATVTVIVGEITSLTGPDRCVMCLNEQYTFTVEACCCDSVDWWAGPVADPAAQDGGCSFTTKFVSTGTLTRQVSAMCGSDVEYTRPYTVEASCAGQSGNPEFVSLGESFGQLSGACKFGETQTAFSEPNGPMYVCFDCGDDQWEVRHPGLRCSTAITYDNKDKELDDGTCEAVASLVAFYNDAESQANGEPGDPSMCTTTDYYSLACLQAHERQHEADIEARFMLEAADAFQAISWLDEPPQEPYCTKQLAANSMMPAAQLMILLIGDNMNTWIAANAEPRAFRAEADCLLARIEQICDGIGECDACDGI